MIRAVLALLALALSSPTREAEPGPDPRRLDVQLLYLDMTECTRCVDAGSRLDEALALLAPVMAETGWEAHLKKVHVTTEDQARTLRFASSPTVRINGADIQLDGRETRCDDCGQLCTSANVTCREWRFQGQWFTSPPKGLFVEAILAAMHSGTPGSAAESRSRAATTPFEVPENLKRFFANRTKPASRPTCCESDSEGGRISGCCESRSASGCTLSPESRPERMKLLQELTRGISERRNLETGILLRFNPEPGVVTRLAQVVELERECCQFLEFKIRVEEAGGPVWLEVTGPASAKHLIEKYFGSK